MYLNQSRRRRQKMKLFVWICLLVPLCVVAGPCINKAVEVVVANGLSLTGDVFDDPDCYVEVTIGSYTQTTNVIESKSNPIWWKTFKFTPSSTDVMTVKVLDQDSGFRGGDDLLGTCTEKLLESKDLKHVVCSVNDGGLLNLFYRCY